MPIFASNEAMRVRDPLASMQHSKRKAVPESRCYAANNKKIKKIDDDLSTVQGQMAADPKETEVTSSILVKRKPFIAFNDDLFIVCPIFFQRRAQITNFVIQNIVQVNTTAGTLLDHARFTKKWS
jgi:hypothetical protein